MCVQTRNLPFSSLHRGCPKFCVKKTLYFRFGSSKKLDMLFWNDLSFAIIVKLRDYCLTKISVELNPIKFFCNNNEIEIIGTLISFPAKWQFFNTKSKEAPMCSSTISRLHKEKLYYFHMTFTFYVIRMFLRTGSQM